jgi:multiple sugar transport system permease protein
MSGQASRWNLRTKTGSWAAWGILGEHALTAHALLAALRTILYYLTVAIVVIPFVMPLAWMIVTAFKPPAQIYADPLGWIPEQITLENFTKAWGLLDFPAFLRNTAFITLVTVIGTLFSSSLVGYAFAMLPGRGKETLFALMIATVMIPPTVTLVPQFILFSKFGWVNTYLPLTVPHFFGNAFYIFLFRQYFRGLSADLFESAEIDGCNPWQAYTRIALPLAYPVLTTVGVLSFIGAWNDFMEPLIYLNSTSKFTVSLGLSLFHGLFYTQIHYLIPMALVALLPVIAVFVIAQRYFKPTFSSTGLTA